MEDSGAILCQISLLKDMLDQVNQEIEANIQITREIESEIVKCSEFEKAMAARESDLTKTLYVSHFEISSLLLLAHGSRNSVESLDKQLAGLRMKRDETLKRINDTQEEFVRQCLEFQRDIENTDDLRAVISEKEYLENEVCRLDKKNIMLKNSMQAFVEEILEDLHSCNCALQVEIEKGNQENKKLLQDIDNLKTMLLSTIIIEDDPW
ncbi:CAP-gly domain linker [Trema orientale]|uniref:CAP-gly domain linker n=1 Tax=Trema orientale TaxID=63057 RepID=A0A2P5EM10_TREOI|nr:CAP-gly domain linker [Trema orientale]